MLILTAVAIAPGLALMIYLYTRDRYEKEPPALVVRTFAAGVVAVVPVLILDFLIAKPVGVLLIGPDEFRSRLWTAFVTAGLVEEFCKLAMVYLAAYRNPQLNEPYDAVLYAAAGSLGFATLENILYVLESGVGTGIIRALLSVPGHALFGVIMGYYLGLAKFSPDRAHRGWNMFMALLVPTMLHGLYDALAFNAEYLVAVLLLIPLMAYLWVRGLRVIRATLAVSPFRPVRLLVGTSSSPRPGHVIGPCLNCGRRVVREARFCHHCGIPLLSEAEPAEGD